MSRVYSCNARSWQRGGAVLRATSRYVQFLSIGNSLRNAIQSGFILRRCPSLINVEPSMHQNGARTARGLLILPDRGKRRATMANFAPVGPFRALIRRLGAHCIALFW